MGLWGRIKKKAKRVGKAVGKTAKKVGRQVKRSAAVAAPALLGPGLGEKVGVAIAKTAGKTAIKSTYSGMSRVSNVTGRIVQIAGTVVGTVFAGPIAGSAIYRGTALLRQLSQHEMAEAKFKAGVSQTRGHNVVWKKQPLRILEGLAAGVGGAVIGAAAGGTSIFASGSSMASGIFGGGTAAAGGASPAMLASTEAMVAGETAAGTAAAGGGVLSTVASVGVPVVGAVAPMLLQRLMGGGGTSMGGTEVGGTEVVIPGSDGGFGAGGFEGMAGQASDFLASDVAGIPMAVIVGGAALLLIWMFWK